MSNEVSSSRSKASSHLKWLFFIFWTLFSFGSNYAFDNPSALKDLIFAENNHAINRQQYEVLFSGFYTFYSIPNIIFPLLNGLFIGKVGVRSMLVFLSFLTLIGQFLVFYGCGEKNFTFMFVGRLIFGYGSESLTAAQNVFITQYFIDSKLAFPISAGNAVALFGTYLNYSFTAQIAKKYGLKYGFLSGLFSCAISFIAILVSLLIDFLIEKYLQTDENNYIPDEVEVLIEKEKEEPIFIDEGNIFARFPKPFWTLLFCSVIIYASSIGFSSIAVSYFVEKLFLRLDLKTAEVESTKIMSLDSLVNIFSSLFLAGFMNYASSFLYIFSTVNAFISLLSFSMFLLAICPVLTLFLDGIASSLNYNILNTIIPRIVKKKDLGLAYCVAVAANNVGTSLIPILAAFLRNARNNYDLAIELFIGLNMVGLVLSIVFYHQYKEKFIKKEEVLL